MQPLRIGIGRFLAGENSEMFAGLLVVLDCRLVGYDLVAADRRDEQELPLVICNGDRAHGADRSVLIVNDWARMEIDVAWSNKPLGLDPEERRLRLSRFWRGFWLCCLRCQCGVKSNQRSLRRIPRYAVIPIGIDDAGFRLEIDRALRHWRLGDIKIGFQTVSHQ